MSDRLVPKLLAEFIGTFSFVFIGAGTAAVVGDGVGLPSIVAIALAHGLAITAFAAAYGSVSGGHMNPAVTVGVLVAGAMDAAAAIFYVISQLLGGMAGALLLQTVLGGTATGLGTPALAHDLALGGISLTITSAAGFMIEAVLAFFLVTVVLSTAVAGRARNVAPLVIGNDADLQYPHGWRPYRCCLQPGAGAWSDGRYRKIRRCLVVLGSSDCRGNYRGDRAQDPRPAHQRGLGGG
jgi:glycerol uptake facilitator-like aquaporin